MIKISNNCVKYEEGNSPNKEEKTHVVKVKDHSETCSYIQSLETLSKIHPYFTVTIKAFSSSSKISIGICGSKLRDDSHMGCQNNSFGYHSDTGHIITNHCSRTQTKSPLYQCGDKIGIYVAHFGIDKSVVIVTKNGRPVGTQFHYEADHSKYFPSISMEHGPMELIVTWPENVVDTPKYSSLKSEDWLLMPGYVMDPGSLTFCQKIESLSSLNASHHNTSLASIQAPEPLTKGRSYYEVQLTQTCFASQKPSLIVCLVSAGASLCAPSSRLYYEVLKFTVNPEVVKAGDRLGWGIHYLEPVEINGRVRQPIICSVSWNNTPQSSVCYLEPEGGYYPFVAFTAQDFKIRLNSRKSVLPFPITPMQCTDHLTALLSLVKQEQSIRDILLKNIVHSDDMTVQITTEKIRLSLGADKVGVNTMQYKGMPLCKDHPVFQVNITSLAEDSVICIGLASEYSSLSKFPGRSVPSLGYHSKDGKILYDGRSQANTQGHRFSEGDQVMIEFCPLPNSSQSALIRIWKNDLPVALRFINIKTSRDLYPTVSLFSGGSVVSCDVTPPNVIEQLPAYFVNDPHYWCLPETAKVDNNSHDVVLTNQVITGQCIVSPVPMSRGMHHFEVALLKDPFADGVVPPMIALTTASPYDPPKESNFRLDLLRFWPRKEEFGPEASTSMVKNGDTIGWGVVFPDENLSDLDEQIVICYLTINRDVILTRALIQPAGGLHASVILPYGCDRVRLKFDAITINSHPFTRANVSQLYKEAKQLINDEEQTIAAGHELPYEHKRLSDYYKPLPLESAGDTTPHRLGDLSEIGIHTTDPFVSKKSKTCIIL